MSNRGKTMRSINKAKVLGRESHLKKILQRMKENDIKPKCLTSISEYAAELITEQEQKPCSPSTLRRNPNYRKHINSFMKQMGYEDYSSSNSNLELELRIRELLQENETLTKQLSSAFQKQALLEHQVMDAVIEKVDKNATSPIDEDLYYKILLQMINSIGYEFDTYNKRVHDDLESRTIFDQEDMPGFFQWYEELSK